jgi:prefoldin subunit 5
MAEQVTIKINVKADTAVIERVRAQLASLCREADDCSNTFDKYSKRLNDTSKSQKRLTETTDNHSSAVKRLSGAQRRNSKDNDSFIKQLFKMDDVGKKLLGGLQGLIKFGFKYVAIEAAAAAAVIGSAGLLFKTGQLFAKGYQTALAGVSYALTALVAAGSAFLAVQQQFASIQFAPMFTKGLVNTQDRFEAADLAMRSFVNSSELAVFGTKALTASFAEMAKNVNPQQLGQVTGAMRTLGNVAAGMGGDIGKNFQEVSKFAAAFQKEGKLTDAVKKQGEGLSPIFKKVIEEQSKAGNTTFEKFMSTLGTNKTFAEAYGGQLDAVNNTVMGHLKGAMTDLKATLTDMGGPLLEPLGNAITHIKHLIEALLQRVRGSVQEIGSGSLINGMVKGVEKLTLLLGRLMTHDVTKAGDAIDKMKGAWTAITGFFEKIQDYLRPLQDAASVLWQALQPILQAFVGNFNSTIQTLSKSLVDNKEEIVGFTTEIAKFLTAFGNFGTVLKEAFIKALPVLKQLASILTMIFTILTKVFGLINKIGGPLGGIATLGAAFLGMRALKIGAKGVKGKVDSKIGSMMPGGGGVMGGGVVGQNVATMNVNAGVVNMSGGVAGGIGISPLNAQGGVGTNPYGPMMPTSPTGFRGAYGVARAGGVGMFGAARAGAGSFFANSPYGPMAMMAGGTMLDAVNQSQFGNNPYLGAGANMLQTGGMLRMMGASAPVAAGAATAVGAWKVGGALSSKFFGNDDSIKGKLGGAATGALAGAAIGSIVPGIGTAAGAAIGGLVGGVSGWLNAGKNKKKARKAAEEFVDGYSSAIDQAFKDGDVAALNELKDSYVEQAKAAAKGNIDVYNEKIKEFEPELEKINQRIDTFTKNAEQMSHWLGMSTDTMNQISEVTGINFQNRLVSVFEVIGRAGEDFGLNLKEVLGNILADIDQKQTSAILDLIEKPGQMAEMGKQLDAAQAAIMSGDTSQGALDEYIKQQFTYAQAQAGGDPMKGLALAMDVIRSQGGKGGALEGKTDILMSRINEMGLLDPQNLVNIAQQSGQVDLMAQELMTLLGPNAKDAQGNAITLDTTKNTLLNQIATGGIAAFTQQEEMLKSYGLTKTGQGGGISASDFLRYGFGGAAQLQTGANMALGAQSYSNGTYGGGGVALSAPVGTTGGISTATGTLQPTSSVQNIQVGETKITVSGILSPSEAELIANAVAKVQNSYGERRGSGRGGLGGGVGVTAS